MAITPAGWSNAVSHTYFDKVLRDDAAKKYWPYEKIYGSGEKSDEFELKMLIYSGLGLPQERKYGEDIQSQDLKELGTATLSDVELALGVDIDRRFLEDNRHIEGFLKKIGKSTGESFSQVKCRHAALPFIRAFSTTNQTLWDSAALCSTTRTLDTGDTYANDLGSMSISFSTSWDLRDKLEYQQFSQKGLRRTSRAKCHLLHNSHKRVTRKIYGQSYEPDTLTRNANTLEEDGIEVIFCPDLGTGVQFMMGPRAMDNCIFWIRKPPTSEWDENKRNRTRAALVHMRILFGILDFEDIVGAQ